MGDVAGSDFAGLDVPQFLDAKTVDLRVDVVELFCGDEIFCERAAGAFGEDCDFGAEFVAGSVVVFGFAVLVEAFVFGDDAGDAFTFVDELSAAEFFEDVDAGSFDQAA